jgi:hypothetical protein
MAPHKQPIWKAVLLAPIAAPFAVSVVIACDAASFNYFTGLRDVPVAGLFFVIFFFGLPMSYVGMFIFGLPYILWLRSRNILTRPLVCLGSSLVGVLVWAGYFLRSSQHTPSVIPTLIAGLLIGLFVGLVFCRIAGLTNGSNRSLRSLGRRSAAP